ncbi:MAG: ferrous iron transport protein B [Bacteroidales bacterium]|jgi:ferrous iron transport protein B|nr:ferrous iron transport protein B [Bacteroidales bacterium]MDD2617650.1 ferrous iron transport protein B [Bacteroidales bacterium]MDD4640258.1 ferrous iron transport protein B [Bacteroidales bacterium]
MRLSELKTGDKAVIVKVYGHGGFRRRIVEMGFVRGKVVECVMNAPLNDPVDYRIMGYHISLRRSEAAMIEVVGRDEVLQASHQEKFRATIEEDDLRMVALKKRKHIRVALVGNPNSGKTSLFNQAAGESKHVGNYSGVTVSASTGFMDFEGYSFSLVDLPGTYSLSAYTPEEVYVRKHLDQELPDVVINVVDAGNLERNLFLTTQLIDMNVRMVVALNMYDELQRSGNKLDHMQLGRLLGVPFVPTVASSNQGLDRLFRIAIKVYEGSDLFAREGLDREKLKELHEYHHKHELSHDTLEELEEDERYKILGQGFRGRRHRHRHLHGWFHNRNQHREHRHEHEYRIGEVVRHVHIYHGTVIEKSIEKIKAALALNEDLRNRYSIRFLSIKLLEGDALIEELVRKLPNAVDVFELRALSYKKIQQFLEEDAESAITNAKYAVIHGALKEVMSPAGKKQQLPRTHGLDAIFTHRYWGYPIFLIFLFLMFQGTFALGNYPMEWIEAGVGWLGTAIGEWMNPGPLKDLLIDGVIGGVGGVIVFLPNILILYFFISFMEDSGYMARAVFIMDKLMHKIGLHGRSFIPLIMGFGCSVPAIMATRSIENRNSRMITILVIPLMSCSARLPVYLLFAGVFFPNYAGLLLFGLYILGIVLAIIMAKLFKKAFFVKEDMPFAMELPPYRLPGFKATLIHMWEKAHQYLKKMGTVILVASILIWFLGYFPRPKATDTEQPISREQIQQDNGSETGGENIQWAGLSSQELQRMEQQKKSYIGRIGLFMEPVLRPLGFDWKISVSLLTGVAAKEIIISTMGVLYAGNPDEEVTSLSERLQSEKYADGSLVFNAAVALSLMVFVLIYFPCVATLAAIRSETGSWKWALFAMSYTILLAWCTAFVVYHLALLFV